MFSLEVNRIRNRVRRFLGRILYRRVFVLRNATPVVSFTFDDFPLSALRIGGALLERYGAVATYYTSLGLMGTNAPTGSIFRREDLHLLLQRGHELGCHTFAHCHSYDTPASIFEDSILENRSALQTLAPGTEFETLSYPISCPSPAIKRRSARYFSCCRGGGQRYNSGKVDLNNVSSFFLEQSRHNPAAIKEVVDANRRACGWLIFATHDVCADPTRFGCTPTLFEDIVRYSIDSGARVLSVSSALKTMGVKPCLLS
jgi:peptidoglycan/xylan/chitin deacetylase (PgdA/CDA1 family)